MDASSQQRTVPVSGVRASRRGIKLLFLFIVGVLAVGVAAAWSAFPVVVITIAPELEVRRVEVPITIDTEIPASLIHQAILKGHKFEVETGSQNSTSSARASVKIDSHVFWYDKNELRSIYALKSEQAAGDGFVPVLELSSFNIAEVRLSPSARSVVLFAQGTVVARRSFDVASWRSNINGMTFEDVQAWLKKKPGVKQVMIQREPEFLAKLKQKSAIAVSSVRFRLDIGEKTSILE